jgi:hypothetical protein
MEHKSSMFRPIRHLILVIIAGLSAVFGIYVWLHGAHLAREYHTLAMHWSVTLARDLIANARPGWSLPEDWIARGGLPLTGHGPDAARVDGIARTHAFIPARVESDSRGGFPN